MTTLVVRQDVASITRDELALHDDGLGDQSFYTAALTIDGVPAGTLFGELRTVDSQPAADGRVWQRMGLATFRFTTRDTIVVAGVVTYPAGEMHSPNGEPFWRAIVGGTGAYAGARGEVESVRSPDGTFVHSFTYTLE